jgi:hypothetical protein
VEVGGQLHILAAVPPAERAKLPIESEVGWAAELEKVLGRK